MLGISCDPIATHERWIATPADRGGLGGLEFALAGDTDGRTCRAFGVYREEARGPLRGLFLIDPAGVVRYQLVHDLGVGRRADEVLRVLAALQSGGACPPDWEPGDPVADPTGALGPGRVVAQYRIEAKLGEGAFAAVYRARDTVRDRPVAVKVLKPGTGQSPTEALAAARAAAAVHHANVCEILDVGAGEGAPLIAMEYLGGRTLAELLAEGPLPGPAPWRLAARSPRASPRRTPPGSSTATSTRGTSS